MLHMRKSLPCFLLAALVFLTSLDADAQRRRAAKPPTPPPVPAACIDFYQDTHREWLAAHPSTYGMPTLSALGDMRAHARSQQQALLDELMSDPRNAAQQTLGALWASGLDEAAIDADGLAPIAPLLAQINAIRRASDIPPVLIALHQAGISAGFSFSAGPDPDGTGLLMATFSEGGMGLPDPDYYLRADAQTRNLLAHYTLYVQQLLRLTGTPEAALRAQMTEVLNLETRLARLSRPLTAMRDGVPDDDASGDTDADQPQRPLRIDVIEAGRRYRLLQLPAFLKALDVHAPQIAVSNPALLPALNRFVAGLKPEQWKIYLRYQVARAMASFLTRDFREATFAFYSQFLSGHSIPPPSRRIEVLAATNTLLGPLLAHEYMARYLEPGNIDAATRIATHVRQALQRGIGHNLWMSQSTKTEAHAKLAALKIEIGVPGTGLDGALDGLPALTDGGFGQYVLTISRWRVARDLRRIGHPDTSADDWDVLPQEPVLAYDLLRNRLIVSAAALQPPIFDPTTNVPAQYGSYGALVGRELSRAVDHHGRWIDASGRWRGWWTDADNAAWEVLLARVAAQYSVWSWPNTPGVKIDGERSAGDNIADIAGIELAFMALEADQGSLDDPARDRFFRSWAGLWREQTSPETALYNAAIQRHVPGHWRSNGPLGNHPAFAQTYRCPPDSGMTRPADGQIAIWR